MSVRDIRLWMVCVVLVLAAPCLSAQISPNDYYGSGIGMDSLANLKVGVAYGDGGAPEVDYRFRATQTASLQSVWPYLITSGSGYASGTGGTLVVELTTDDGTINHLPTSDVLASAELENAYGKPAFSQFDLNSPTLQAGTIYHLVWYNSDSNPSQNYVSLDFVFMISGTNPAQPTIRPEDFDAFELDGSTWVEMAPPTFTGSWTPIANLVYGNEATQGLGYIEILGAENIGGSGVAVREKITTGSNEPDRTLVRMSVRAARVSGSSSLHIVLEDGSGSPITDCYVPSSKFATAGIYYWVTCAFTSTVTFTPNSTYFFDLEASSGTTYEAYALENGVLDGFGSGTTFADGLAEFENGSGWQAWYVNGKQFSQNQAADLQFYFTLE